MALFIKKNGALQQVSVGNKVIKPEQANQLVELNLASGNQEVTPQNAEVMAKVTILKPDTLTASNIKNGTTIAGVQGNYITPNESQTVTLDLEQGDQVVNPSAAGMLINQVTITKPATLVKGNIKKDVTIAGVTGNYTGNLNITPSYQVQLDLTSQQGQVINTPSGYDAMEQVVVDVPQTAVPSNIKSGVNIGGIVGTYGGGGADYLEQRCNNNIENYSSNNVTQLPTYMFFNCSSLKSISLPNCTTFISNGSYGNHFYGCSNLETIDFPNLTDIGDSELVFTNGKFTTASFPKLSIINKNFMGYNNYLTSISFGALTRIKGSGNHFPSTSNLTDITIATNQVCTLDSSDGVGATSTKHITFHVPSNLISSYQTATNWTTLYNNGYISFVAIS